MKNCPNCNAELYDNAIYCTSCGIKVENNSEAEQNAADLNGNSGADASGNPNADSGPFINADSDSNSNPYENANQDANKESADKSSYAPFNPYINVECRPNEGDTAPGAQFYGSKKVMHNPYSVPNAKTSFSGGLLAWSITNLVCGLLFGGLASIIMSIIALVKVCNVQNLTNPLEIASSNNTAKILNIISTVLSAIVFILLVIILTVAIVSAIQDPEYYQIPDSYLR